MVKKLLNRKARLQKALLVLRGPMAKSVKQELALTLLFLRVLGR